MEDVRARRLCLCGHLARAKPSTDYARALHSLTMQCIRGFGGDALCKLTFCVTLRVALHYVTHIFATEGLEVSTWQSRTTWLQTVESDFQPANIGMFTT